MDSLLRSVGPTTWLGDNDIGEQFHNFSLHPDLQPYCGIDLTKLFPERSGVGKTIAWEHWSRAPMGVMQSPYQAAEGMAWWEESVRGDRHSTTNPLHWSHVAMNLPGSNRYNPAKPWVYKARPDGEIAADFQMYVDDLRASGQMKEDCWQVTRLIGMRAAEAGIQDASRKRREVSQSPGAWAGSVLTTDNTSVGITVSQEKWEKTQRILLWLRTALEEDPSRIPFKQLESERGFLVYITRTYPAAVPYLKGVHLTLDSWREGRDEDGWAVAQQVREVEEHLRNGEEVDTPEAPMHVSAMTRLLDDVNVLIQLFDGPMPNIRMARPLKSAVAIYGFGDASGFGFGSTLIKEGRILYQLGKWSEDIAKESLNYRELCNLVEAVEEHSSEGQL